MNKIEVNPDPAMCRHLGAAGVFEADPIVIVDVGARDGFKAEWSVFGTGMRVFCFEPDEEECERLNRTAPPQVTYIPAALGRERQEQTLYEARLSYSTGLYLSDMDFYYRLLNAENAELVGEKVIWIETLNQVMADRKIAAINFIKLDAEGAELDILMGGTNLLRSAAMFGVLTEIRFHPEINGSPPFWQMDQYLHAQGFRLFDISANPHSRAALPYAGVQDYFLPGGKRFYAYTVHGQVMDGDALYFRDVLARKNAEIKAKFSPTDVLKLAAFYELYQHNDAAAEIILSFQEQLQPFVDCELLLNLLTPPLKGEELSYREYMAKYFDPRTSFAPSLDQAPVQTRSKMSTREAALGAELSKVFASTSWRITKPLRTVGALMRHALAKSAVLRWITKPMRIIRAHLLGLYR